MEDKPTYSKKKGTSLWLVKDDNGVFHPLNDSDYEKARLIPQGEENLYTLKRVRNPKFHRKYFAMLNLVFDNQDDYKDFDQFRLIFQMRAGYYDAVQTDKGTAYLPRSISYEAMDETEFSELFEKVWIELQKFVQIDRETLESELSQFA